MPWLRHPMGRENNGVACLATCMTQIYHTYSDYSCHPENGAAYAYIVATYKPTTILRMRSHRCGQVESQVGELMGIIAALKHVPEGCQAVVHCDIYDIENFIDKPLEKVKGVFREPLRQLRKQTERLKVRFRYIPRDSRNDFFRWCHGQARQRCQLSVGPRWKQTQEIMEKYRG